MKVLCFGEILWDIIEGKHYIGGAPFNVAAHLAQFGCSAYLVSAVGNDELGQKALDIAKGFAVNVDYSKVDQSLPTGTVPVSFNEQGKHSFTITENCAWDNINLTDKERQDISEQPWFACCFGSLAQRRETNRSKLYQLLADGNIKEKYFDVNLRQHYYSQKILIDSFDHTTIAKLNEEEVIIVSDLVFSKKMSEHEFCKALRERFNIHTICITKGGEGVLIDHLGIITEYPASKVEVKDTIGAGDSFSAAFLWFWHQTGSIHQAAQAAVKVSGFVASESGAVPRYPAWIHRL